MENGNASSTTPVLSQSSVFADVHPISSTAPQLCVQGQQHIIHDPLAQSLLLRKSILNDVLLRLPAMFEEFMMQNERSYMDSPDEVDTKALQRDVMELKRQSKDWENRIKGYEKRLTVWTGTVSSIDEELTTAQNKVVAFSKEMKLLNKNFTKKTDEINTMRIAIQKTIEETDKARLSLKKSIDDLKVIDGKKIIAIEGSQEFVSDQYDKIIESTKELKNNFTDLEKRVQKNSQKSEKNANYPRRDCLELSGIPVRPDHNGEEDCKQMVMDICKELHLSLRSDAISTAHRLKQHPSKTGPPPIIVKFCRRDDRNDVFFLRKQLKSTQVNILGIERLFINESLTPEKKKLLYECKKYTRENFVHFGKIFIWSFKGDLFARQNVENANKFQINHMDDFILFGTTCINTVENENDSIVDA